MMQEARHIAQNELAVAILSGDSMGVERLSRRSPDLLSTPIADHEGVLPLHLSIGTSSMGVVKALLALGADPNQLDQDGVGPLHLAAASGRPELVAVLLDAAADEQLVGANDVTPTELALSMRGREDESYQLLVLARTLHDTSTEIPASWSFARIHAAVELGTHENPTASLADRIGRVITEMLGDAPARLGALTSPMTAKPSHRYPDSEWHVYNGTVILGQDALYYSRHDPSALLFANKTVERVPWSEIASAGFGTGDDPWSLFPWSKVHHVWVRGRRGADRVDIWCTGKEQAFNLAEAINEHVA